MLRSKHLTALICSAYLSVGVAVALLSPDNVLISSFADDSFFYTQTAKNIALGLGSTFDGLNPTNGYHPLWMLFLVGVATLHPLQGYSGLRALLVLHVLMVSVVLVLTHKLLAPLRLHPGVVSAMLLVVVMALGLSDIAMETALLCIIMECYLIKLSAYQAGDRRSAWAVALCSFLLPFARIDAVLIATVVAGWLAFTSLVTTRRLTPPLALLSVAALPAVVADLSIGLFNLHYFGHFETISSHVKRLEPTAVGHYLRTLTLQPIILRITVLSAASVFGGLYVWRTRLTSAYKQLFAALNLYSLCYFAALVLLSDGRIGSWYLTPNVLIAITTLAVVLDDLLARAVPVRLQPVAASVLSLALIAGTAWFWSQRRLVVLSQRIEQVDVGLWLKQRLRVGETVFAVDGAGFTAYFSERPVINGDGLINGWAYQDALHSGQLPAYLADAHVRYVVVSERESRGYLPGTALAVRNRRGGFGYAGLLVPGRTPVYQRGVLGVFRLEDLTFVPGSW